MATVLRLEGVGWAAASAGVGPLTAGLVATAGASGVGAVAWVDALTSADTGSLYLRCGCAP